MAKIPKASELPDYHSVYGSSRMADDPIPPGYITLKDFIQTVGQGLFPKEWTGEECECVFDNWGEVRLSSEYEKRIQQEYEREKFKLELLATFGEIDSRHLDLYDDKVTAEAEGIEIHGDLVSPNKSEIKKLNARFSTKLQLGEKIKARRDKAITNSLVPALWSEELVALVVNGEGALRHIKGSLWFKESDWAQFIYDPSMPISPKSDDGIGRRTVRSIILKEELATEWLQRLGRSSSFKERKKRVTAKVLPILLKKYPDGVPKGKSIKEFVRDLSDDSGLDVNYTLIRRIRDQGLWPKNANDTNGS